MKTEFEELEDKGFDLDLTGFKSKEIAEIWDKDDKGDISQVDQLGKHMMKCPKCEHRFERKDGK